MIDIQKSFLDWWENEGSALRPLGNEDHEEFARRVTEIAWLNGAFAQKYGLEK